MAAVIFVDRKFRYDTVEHFYDDIIAAGLVVPRDENNDVILDMGLHTAVFNDPAPGLRYDVGYSLFIKQTPIGDPVGDPPVAPTEDRGLHINMRVTGARANAISAQLDNFYRTANPAVDVETPANVIAFYDLAVAGTENPGQKIIRKGTALTNGMMFDIAGTGQASDKTSPFFARARTFGAE